MRLIPWACAVALALSTSALAHVGPSPDVNNRYVKLSALGDGVRLVYTIYFGEAPGRALRPRLDRDHDGALASDESRWFGAELGAEVAAGLSLEVDGQATAVRWHAIEVGLGEPTTRGGSLAVDLVAWACFAGPVGGRHRVVLRDHFALPSPGESELRVEDSPGVVELAAGLADGPPDRDLRWRGPDQPTAAAGYRLEVEVDPAVAATGGVCGRPGPGPTRSPWPYLAAGAVVAAALGLVVVRALRRRTGS